MVLRRLGILGKTTLQHKVFIYVVAWLGYLHLVTTLLMLESFSRGQASDSAGSIQLAIYGPCTPLQQGLTGRQPFHWALDSRALVHSHLLLCTLLYMNGIQPYDQCYDLPLWTGSLRVIHVVDKTLSADLPLLAGRGVIQKYLVLPRGQPIWTNKQFP